MSLLDFLKKKFIDILQWPEEEEGLLVWRHPLADQEIQTGAKLVVRESQAALLVEQGKAADLFGPGTHTLTTANMPLLTNLKNWDKLFKSPFKTDVYFFTCREQIDMRWGTAQPVTIRDHQLGLIRLRAHGTYSYCIQDPRLFYGKVSGNRENFSQEDLDGQLRAGIMTQFASSLGQQQRSFLDMAANQADFSALLRESIAPFFAGYGLTLEKFLVQSLTLPDEVQQKIDKVASMNAVGDMGRYTQFQTAESLEKAAASSGGSANLGVGAGIGMILGETAFNAFKGPSAAGQGSEKTEKGGEEALANIERLHALWQKGIISEQEFNAKKDELLKKIT